ncbi:MAG: hypothetical protein J6L81_10795 [Clostridia bacterium]|nr:hypothetical protein [Clostridia bacterium]
MSDLLEYKCPCCGGAVEFSASLQKMKCPYCDSEFDVSVLNQPVEAPKEDKMDWDIQPGGEWKDGETDGMLVYVCKSCGGEIIGDATTAATSCPYCDNPIVMTGQFSGDLRPDYVIPFKLNKEQAKEGLSNYLKDKWLLPKQFKSENKIDEIKGVYVPFWLFDADADVDIEYRGTKVRRWSDSNYNYTETSYYALYRSGVIGFNNVPVDGSTKMADELMESLEPYDFSEAVDFQTAYLAGYLADKYDVNSEQSIERANERIKKSVEEAFYATTSEFGGVVAQNSSIQLSNSKAKYALYPVWMLNTTWQDQKFTFAMNGQTGKFVGNLPMDKKKYWIWFAIIAAIVAAAIMLFAVLFSC